MENRQLKLTEILSAFNNSAANRIQNSFGYLKNVSRYGCSSDIAQLKIQCLIDLAKQQCQSYPKKEQEDCLLYSDVMVTNIMETDVFIPRKDLFRIYRNSVGVKDPTKEALRRRYAIQAVQFINESDGCDGTDFKCLSKEIDDFCMNQSTKKKQSYQGCASSLIWFYSTNTPTIQAKNKEVK